MWSDSVKTAPSYSTDLLPVCLRVTSSAFPDKNKCLFPSAQCGWYGRGKGSWVSLCFKYQQLSSDWRTLCQFGRQRRTVWLWVLRWRCRETEKKKPQTQVFGWWPGNQNSCNVLPANWVRAFAAKRWVGTPMVRSTGNSIRVFTQFWFTYVKNIGYMCQCLALVVQPLLVYFNNQLLFRKHQIIQSYLQFGFPNAVSTKFALS